MCYKDSVVSPSYVNLLDFMIGFLWSLYLHKYLFDV